MAQQVHQGFFFKQNSIKKIIKLFFFSITFVPFKILDTQNELNQPIIKCYVKNLCFLEKTSYGLIMHFNKLFNCKDIFCSLKIKLNIITESLCLQYWATCSLQKYFSNILGKTLIIKSRYWSTLMYYRELVYKTDTLHSIIAQMRLIWMSVED